MSVRDEAWPEGTPCWVDAQLDDLDKGQEFYAALFGWTFESSDDEQYGGYRIASLEGRPVAGLGRRRPRLSGRPDRNRGQQHEGCGSQSCLWSHQ